MYLFALTALILTFCNANVQAQEYSLYQYYGSEFYQEGGPQLSDEALIDQLHKVVTKAHIVTPGQDDRLSASCEANTTCFQHHSVGYREARRVLFGYIHLQETANNYFIEDSYCEKVFDSNSMRSPYPGPHKIPNPNDLNTEHTWPQSRFSGRFSKGTQKADLHALYPTDSSANSTRGNIEFAEVIDVTSSPCPGAKKGHSAIDQHNFYFEPPDSHKGNVARALFYFSIRYRISISQHEESFLRHWHQIDPVDEFEAWRNQAVFEAQGNRNPFIDMPEAVDQISDF